MINTASSISGATTSVAMDAPPPVPLMEPVVPSPGPGYVWANGEWVWNNGWYWSTGYWLWPPFPGTVWVGGFGARAPRLCEVWRTLAPIGLHLAMSNKSSKSVSAAGRHARNIAAPHGFLKRLRISQVT